MAWYIPAKLNSLVTRVAIRSKSSDVALVPPQKVPILNPRLSANSRSAGGCGVTVTDGVTLGVTVLVTVAVDVCVGIKVLVGVDVPVGTGMFVGVGIAVGVGAIPQAVNTSPKENAPLNLRNSRRDSRFVMLNSPSSESVLRFAHPLAFTKACPQTLPPADSAARGLAK